MAADSNQLMGNVSTMRAIAVMDEPSTIADKILFPRKFITLFTGNVWITTPVPTIVEVTGHAGVLDSKQAVVTTRVLGAAADRDVAYNVVKLDLNCWKALVQMTADGDPENAVTIIESSGFKVKHVSIQEKPILKVLKGNAPKSAKLIAKAVGRKASYEWQSSYDGISWNNLPKSTPVANTIANNITSATLVYFRYRGITTTLEGDWCDPVAFIRL